MSWVVGKTLVSTGLTGDVTVVNSERWAQYKLAQIMREHKMVHESVVEGKRLGWGSPLARLGKMIDDLDSGGWPLSGHGLNWVCSLPWDDNPKGDRDVWVFWARQEGGEGGSGESVTPLFPGPTGGLKKELATSAA